jgi:uncharacterized protein (TIGR03435 family)
MATPLPVVAGNTPEFEVASVRQNKSNGAASINVDPTFSDGPVPAGGLYLARNIKLIQFIAFSYRLTTSQLKSVDSAVPWATEERFDIDARAEGNPTKAQYRLMMQALLADRIHTRSAERDRVIRLNSSCWLSVRITESLATSHSTSTSTVTHPAASH